MNNISVQFSSHEYWVFVGLVEGMRDGLGRRGPCDTHLRLEVRLEDEVDLSGLGTRFPVIGLSKFQFSPRVTVNPRNRPRNSGFLSRIRTLKLRKT